MAKGHIVSASPYLWAFLLDQYAPGWPTGNVWWVHSVTGLDAVAPQGKNPESPFATLAYAIAAASASNGDVIIVMAGHSEDLTSAAAININKIGLTIVGMGTGRDRPTFNYTTAVAASFDVNSARTTLKNLVFTPTGVDNVTAALNVKAADCVIEECEFDLANATNQAALGLLATAAATRMIVRRCDFHGTGDAGTTNAIQYGAADDVQVLDNHFHGAYATGSGAIQNTAAAKNSRVFGNEINNLTALCTKAMIFHASTTGQIGRNTMQVLSGTAPVTGAAMSWVGGNYYANAVATAGTLI